MNKRIRADLGVRTFQGLGKNSPAREQVVRHLTRDVHTKQILESLPCESHLQVPLHRKCLPDCGPTTSHTHDIETTFVYRFLPRLCGPTVPCVDPPPSRLPSGGGSDSLGSASLSKIDTSVRSTLGTRTLSVMRQFIEDAEKDSEKETGTGVSELNVKDTRCDSKDDVSCQEGSTTRDKEAIKALKMLFEDFEDRLQYENEVLDESTSEDGEEQEEPPQETAVYSAISSPCDETREFLPSREPQLYLCDDWIQPMAVISRPKELTARDKMRANLAKNCLIVTLMSLELGYGSILERYQQERSSSPALGAVSLTEEELFVRVN